MIGYKILNDENSHEYVFETLFATRRFIDGMCLNIDVIELWEVEYESSTEQSKADRILRVKIPDSITFLKQLDVYEVLGLNSNESIVRMAGHEYKIVTEGSQIYLIQKDVDENDRI